MEADLQAIRDAVSAATLSEDLRQGLLWCLDQLPGLYRELRQTCESRYTDEISRLVRVMLQRLAERDAACPDAAKVAQVMALGLRAMHERLGIPRLDFKQPAPPKRARPPAAR
jgi:hypothetical protein